MISRFDSKCRLCGSPVRKGVDEISKREGVWAHTHCPTRPSRTVVESDYVTSSPRVTRGQAEESTTEFDLLDAVPAQAETIEIVPAKVFTPSRDQRAFYTRLNDTGDNIALIACPGSGKTTTLKHSAPYLKQGERIVMLAFNKRNAKDLEAVMPSWVECSTFHALGLKNITSAWGRVKVDDKKVYTHLSAYADTQGYETRMMLSESGAAIRKLISLCKNTLREPNDANLSELADYYSVELESDTVGDVFKATASVYTRALSDRTAIDFDDMIALPAMGIVPSRKWDVIGVDEGQDTNVAQLEALKRMHDGRVLVVADPRQSLYAFRSADANAVPNLIKTFDMVQLPLSVSYRMPTSHVAHINTLFPDAHIEAREGAPEGLIATIDEDKASVIAQPGDMFICRVNAPLVPLAFSFIRKGIKAVILGRDIGANLTSLMQKASKRAHSTALIDVIRELCRYTDREVSKLLSADKQAQALSLEDTRDTLLALSDGCDTMDELTRKIASVFSDEAIGVTFASIHKAKGAEAERVFILRPELIPHPRAQKPHELQQEQNCLFVALSRSKSEMYFVTHD